MTQKAREYLGSQGLIQWQGLYPAAEDILADIAAGTGWLFTHEGKCAGYVCLETGAVPGYDAIEGKWLTETPYASIHRIMVQPEWRRAGLAAEMIQLCEDLAMGRGFASVKADTHPDNGPMNGLLRKCGYAHCGTIYIVGGDEDGQPRAAYEKLLY